MLYRIRTEDKNLEGIQDLADGVLDGYTILLGNGYWQGGSEKSVILEVIAEEEREDDIYWLAGAIKELNNQDAVIVERQEVQAELV